METAAPRPYPEQCHRPGTPLNEQKLHAMLPRTPQVWYSAATSRVVETADLRPRSMHLSSSSIPNIFEKLGRPVEVHRTGKNVCRTYVVGDRLLSKSAMSKKFVKGEVGRRPAPQGVCVTVVLSVSVARHRRSGGREAFLWRDSRTWKTTRSTWNHAPQKTPTTLAVR